MSMFELALAVDKIAMDKIMFMQPDNVPKIIQEAYNKSNSTSIRIVLSFDSHVDFTSTNSPSPMKTNEIYIFRLGFIHRSEWEYGPDCLKIKLHKFFSFYMGSDQFHWLCVAQLKSGDIEEDGSLNGSPLKIKYSIDYRE